jgi:hypothetical protein
MSTVKDTLRSVFEAVAGITGLFAGAALGEDVVTANPKASLGEVVLFTCVIASGGFFMGRNMAAALLEKMSRKAPAPKNPSP